MAFHPRFDRRTRLGTHFPVDELAVLEEEQTRNGLDVEFRGEFLIGIEIDLCNGEVWIRSAKCLENWSQDAARTTPGRREVDERERVFSQKLIEFGFTCEDLHGFSPGLNAQHSP